MNVSDVAVWSVILAVGAGTFAFRFSFVYLFEHVDEVPAPVEENIYEMSEEERLNRGIGMLPGSLDEAIKLTENSAVVREALGDHTFDAFIANKKIEWDAYRMQVTEYELKRYLPVL